MARCNCAGGTCACSIVEGTGISVDGAGSVNDPYRIAATGNIEGALQVVPTSTVTLQLDGEGNQTSPFVLRGDATVSMAELTDVSDIDIPAVGDVPTWMGDHWEFQPSNTTTPGVIAHGAGILGDGSAGNPLKAATSGTWGSGTLGPVPPWPTDSTLGAPVYTDSNNQLRARMFPFQYNNSTETPANPWGVVQPGWSMSAWTWARWGPLMFLAAAITRTGGSISNPASSFGNITNTPVIDFLSWMPSLFTSAASLVVSASTGPNCVWAIGTNLTTGKQAVHLNAVPPGYTVPTGSTFTFNGFYLTGADLGSPSLPHGTQKPYGV